MTAEFITGAEASGITTPGASAVSGFISIANAIVVMLSQLADEVRPHEPGTAEVITTFAENVSGQALDTIGRWPT
jgi:hypothetical protein